MILQKIYTFFSSARLAIGLLITILVCCLFGVTILREERAAKMIFGTLWFNAILVVLVVNIAFCFFGRIWGRKVTIISLGMILFHLSFVAMLGGIIYNSLFFFQGSIRVTEGESVLSGSIDSYDAEGHGLFFDFAKLQGETALIKMHNSYNIDGSNKRAAYEIAVGEGGSKKQGVIYVTKKMEHNGFDYFNEKEGYSVLISLEDKKGKNIYSAFVPLQSYQQNKDMKNRVYLYSTGTKEGPDIFAFPNEPMPPLFSLQISYSPSSKIKEMGGDISLQVFPLFVPESSQAETTLASGEVPVGGTLAVGDYMLTAKEVRYWVGMSVRHDPGKPFVLTSLWVGLIGMIVTFFGRMIKSRPLPTD